MLPPNTVNQTPHVPRGRPLDWIGMIVGGAKSVSQNQHLSQSRSQPRFENGAIEITNTNSAKLTFHQ
jgi:hypothetical protein